MELRAFCFWSRFEQGGVPTSDVEAELSYLND